MVGAPGEEGTVGARGALADAPIAETEVATPPVLVSRVLPEYPPLARARGLEGLVILRAVVGRDGRVEAHVGVQRSDPAFDAAAIAALRQWRFHPGKDGDGHLVRVLIEVPVRFRLR
jgi:protein TonB